MNCRLCGHPTAGPDKMCGDCGRALKRAREGSAALRNAPGSAVEGEPASPPPIELPPVPAPARARGRPIAAYCAIGLVGIGATFFAMRAPEPTQPRSGASEPAQLQGNATSRSTEDAAQQGASAATMAAPEAASVTPADIPTAVVLPSSPARPKATPAPANAKQRSNVRNAGRTAPGKANVVTAPLNDTAVSDAANVEPPPQVARAPAAPVPAKEAAPSLSNALERCSGEKFISGVICEQKVRLQFCEGKWGQVPECSSKPRVD